MSKNISREQEPNRLQLLLDRLVDQLKIKQKPRTRLQRMLDQLKARQARGNHR